MLLPIDPSRVSFSSVPGWTRADQETAIRTTNANVSASQDNRPGVRPTTIQSWLTRVCSLPTANDAYLPPSWSADATLYSVVFNPYCQSCHRAVNPALDFDRAAEFRGFWSSIRNDACKVRSMPHEGTTFE